MANKDLIAAAGRYIEKYYEPERDDIVLDSKMKGIFSKITRKREALRGAAARNAEEEDDFELCDNAVEFDPLSMQAEKLQSPMAATIPTQRNLDDLMSQMDETFSERLLRMIDERGLTDSEAYNKAYVDRRHFSKIRKDREYAPNKKTVLAFSIALELSVDECKDLLGCAGFTLSRSSKTDIIVAYCLQNKIYNMFDVNDVLEAYGQPMFSM